MQLTETDFKIDTINNNPTLLSEDPRIIEPLKHLACKSVTRHWFLETL